MTKRNLKLIVAHDENNVIGKGLTLPWNQKADLARVKTLTTSGKILMGYNTYLSLNKKPLKNRVNIVISDNEIEDLAKGFLFISDSPENLNEKFENAFVFGGAKTYEDLLPYTKEIYLTKIYTKIKGRGLYKFPELKKSDWITVELSKVFEADEKNEFPYQFIKLVHRSSLD